MGILRLLAEFFLFIQTIMFKPKFKPLFRYEMSEMLMMLDEVAKQNIHNGLEPVVGLGKYKVSLESVCSKR